MSGTLIRLDLTPAPGANLGFTSVFLALTTTNPTAVSSFSPSFVFQGELTDVSGGVITATLITVTEVSVLEGSMVECVGVDSTEGSLTITVAGEKLKYT